MCDVCVCGRVIEGMLVCVCCFETVRDREVNCWLEVCACVCVWICHHDSLLLQPHPVCETLGWALSCPTLGNYTHFISTCKTAGGIQPENGRPSREAKTDYFHFHLSSAIFFLFFFFSTKKEGRRVLGLAHYASICHCLCQSLCWLRPWLWDKGWIEENRGVVIECSCVHSLAPAYSLWLTARKP